MYGKFMHDSRGGLGYNCNVGMAEGGDEENQYVLVAVVFEYKLHLERPNCRLNYASAGYKTLFNIVNGKYAMPKDDDSSGVRRLNDFAGEDNSRLRNMFEFFHIWRPQDIAGDKEQFERLLQHHQMKGNVLMEMRRALGPLCYSFALIQIVCRMVGPEVGLPLLGWEEHRRDHPGNPYYLTSEIRQNLDAFTSKGKAPTEE